MKSAGKRDSNWSPSSGERLERVVELRGGHRAGVEPRVEHRIDAARAGPLALRAVDGDVVDRGTVEVEVGEVAARPLGELGHRTDAGVGAAVVAAPHRQRRAPEAVARQRPVDVVLEPVAEASVLDVLGVPADGLVLAQQLVLVRRGAREPRGLGPVDERRAAAPAVRVRVRVVDDPLQLPGRGERVDDRGVGVLHEGARPRRGSERGVDERRPPGRPGSASAGPRRRRPRGRSRRTRARGARCPSRRRR